MSPDSTENTELRIQPESSLASLPTDESSALTEIINRSLVHLQTSRTLATRHRVGGHELCGPDYRLVCILAEQLHLTPEKVLEGLMVVPDEMLAWLEEDIVSKRRTYIENGRFKHLFVFQDALPISSFPKISGLAIEKLSLEAGLSSDTKITNFDLSILPSLVSFYCVNNALTELDVSMSPNLTDLDCACNELTYLDLSAVSKISSLNFHGNKISSFDYSMLHNLTSLECGCNNFDGLDLSSVPRLKRLRCVGNSLTHLDLTKIPELRSLDCSENELVKLDLSSVPHLQNLDCSDNYLEKLDLKFTPNLASLDCRYNQLAVLDIRQLIDLKNLKSDSCRSKPHLLQRSNQNFK